MIQLNVVTRTAGRQLRRVLCQSTAIVALLLPGVARAADAPTTYQGPTTDSNWSTPGNWTNGAPGGGSAATVDNGGTVDTDGGNATDTLAIGAGSGVSITDNSALAVGSAITNAGTLSLNAAGNAAELRINNTTVTLSGGGTVALGDNAGNLILDTSGNNSGVLINVDNTIAGSGNIGAGSISIDNQAAGTINADQSVQLLLQTNGAGAHNEGLLEATADGTLYITNTSVTQSGAGTILATGPGATVLLSNSTINGGTLSSAAGGTLNSVDIDTLNGTTISAGSTYNVTDNSATNLIGTIENLGTVALGANNNAAELRINNQTVSLIGGGTVALGNNAGNYILDTSGDNSGALINVNNLIAGSGNLGRGSISIDNQSAGTINADQSTPLILQANGAGTSNEGLIEATSGGSLSIAGSSVTQSGTGTILATGANATTTLSGTTISGGTLSSTNGGTLTSVGNDTLSGVTISTGSTYTLTDNSQTNLTGTIINHGTIALDAVSNQTELRINNQAVTLTGGGTVALGNNTGNLIHDTSGNNSGALANVDNTIIGSGNLGAGSISIDNQAAGTINADQSTPLILQANGAGTSNEGLIEATAGGSLVITGSTVTQSDTGTILATGANATTTLNSTTISGGTLSSTNGGTLTSQGNNTLSGVTISTGSTYILTDNSQTNLTGTITNHGTIALDAVSNQTELRINNQAVTLTGGGTVALGNNGGNLILDATGNASGVLINQNNTIIGSGNIGAGSISIDNQAAGTINADQSTPLILQANGAGTSNEGLIEATSGGSLSIAGSSVTQSGTGTILATGANATTTLSGTTISGGTLSSTNGGTLTSVGNDTLSGVTISTGSTYTLTDNSQTNLTGTIINHGTIALDAVSNQTELRINNQAVTLTGGGTVALGNNGGNLILDATGNASGVLINLNNTIEGAGNLGAGSIALNNSGIVDANAAGGTLILQGNGFNGGSPTTSAVYNQNLIEASGGGTLDTRGTVTQTSTGILQANAGSTVLIDAATISGGTLATSGTGVMQAIGTSTFNTLTVGSGSTVAVADAAAINLVGTISNQGTISLNAVGNTSELRINNQTVTLAGGGTVSLGNSGNNLIRDTSGDNSGVLINQNNTIEGGGQVGAGSISIANGGLILADAATGLNVNTNGAGLTNTGTLQASNGAVLNVQGGPLTNFSAGTLTGGTYEADANSAVNLNTAGIVTNAATLTLSGLGSAITTQAGAIETTLTTNASGGQLNILADRSYATANDIGNAGTIALGGGAFAANSLSDTGTFTGFGSTTLADGPIANSGSVVANGGTLTLASGIAGTGTLQINAGATANLASAPGTPTAGTLTQNGALALAASGITVSQDYTNANFGTGNAFNKTANVTGGPINAAGNITQSISGATVLNGASSDPTLSLGEFHTTDAAHATAGASATFTIDNNGTSGPVLRGAIQTTGITSAQLSGSGVTAGNFGPIAVGGQSGPYTVSVAGTSAGVLTGQSIHIANNFANVAEQTVAITGTGYNYAQATVDTTQPVSVGNFRVGTTATSALSISNSAAPGAFTENLDAASGGSAMNGASVSGGFTGLAAGSSSSALSVGLTSQVAGAVTGSAAIAFTSDATGVDSLGSSALASQSVSVTGNAFRLATGSATTPVAAANVHVGASDQVALTVQNTAASDGFSEKLDGTVASTSGNITASSGAVSLLAAGSSSTAISVALDTSTAGAKSGTVGVNFASNGAGTDGAAAIANGSATVAVTGNVYNLATSSAVGAIDFGVLHTNTGIQTQSFSVTNTAAAGAYSEGLDTTIGGVSNTGGVLATASGSSINLAAGATDSSSLKLSVNTNQAGSIGGTVTLLQASDGAIDGLANTALATQTPGFSGTVEGTITNLAQAQINTTVPVAFGNVRIGSTAPTQALSITNAAPASQYSESLIAQTNGATGGVTLTGGFGTGTGTGVASLAAQSTDTSHVIVGLNTSAAGVQNGNAVIDFQSDGTAFNGGTITDLGNTDVAVTGAVYRLAAPVVNTPSISLAARVGGAASGSVSLTNASPDAYTEGLAASFSGATPSGFTSTGTISNLAAQGTDASTLKVALNTAVSGSFSGTQTIALASNGLVDNASSLALADASVSVSGQVFQTATASVAPNPVNFGIVHVGDTVAAQTLSVGNTANGALNDVLTGGFATVVGPFSGSGTLGSGVAAGSTSTALSIGLNTATAGVYSSTATLALSSHDSALSDVSVAAGPVALSATVNNYALSGLGQSGGSGTLSGGSNDYVLNFGTITSGTSLSSMLFAANLATGPADVLAGTFSIVSGSGFDFTGASFSDLAAGSEDTDLSAGFADTTTGSFTEEIALIGTGSNASGYSGQVATTYLTLEGTVASAGGGGGGGTSVPEPGTMSLFASAALALFGLRRHRQRRG